MAFIASNCVPFHFQAMLFLSQSVSKGNGRPVDIAFSEI